MNTDFLGNPINVGDTVLYPTTLSSSIYMNVGRVEVIDELVSTQHDGIYVRHSERFKAHPVVFELSRHQVVDPYTGQVEYVEDLTKAYTLKVKKLSQDGREVSSDARSVNITAVERVVVITSLV